MIDKLTTTMQQANSDHNTATSTNRYCAFMVNHPASPFAYKLYSKQNIPMDQFVSSS